jgi:hypothetical protein
MTGDQESIVLKLSPEMRDEITAATAELRAEVDAQVGQFSQLTLGLHKLRADHADWSAETFGGVGPVGALKHLAKETAEAIDALDDATEWADMWFLLWDAQRRAGITDT